MNYDGVGQRFRKGNRAGTLKHSEISRATASTLLFMTLYEPISLNNLINEDKKEQSRLLGVAEGSMFLALFQPIVCCKIGDGYAQEQGSEFKIRICLLSLKDSNRGLERGLLSS